MSHETHLSDTVGTLRPDICDDCRELARDVAPADDVELAQSKLNRAVSRWANKWPALEGSHLEMDLHTAFTQYRDTVQRSFMATVNTEPVPADTPAEPVPTYDPATEARIANLLALAAHPIPLGVDAANQIRKRAHWEALKMLGLTD